jgi:basic membrane protein A
MGRLVKVFLAFIIVASLLMGCNGNNTNDNTPGVNPTAKPEPSNESVNNGIAMITSGGTIDDHSFNHMLWEGLAKAGNDFGFKPAFIEETGASDEELLGGITALYEGGNRLIFSPGFALNGAMNEARQIYKDLSFVMVDVVTDSSPNVVSTSFAIEQAGFLAGVATAVELNSGECGFIGAMEISGIQLYNWGFQQGLMYANDFYNTSVTMKAENTVYEGSFNNFEGGKSIAARMYDSGVKAILIAAGNTGTGALEEARERAGTEDAWIIAVDFDQYERGMYDGTNSVILTSAVKKYGSVAYELSKMFIDDNFPGGEIIRMDIVNDGVGIPNENPNLSKAAIEAANLAAMKLKEGSLEVIDYPEGLIP